MPTNLRIEIVKIQQDDLKFNNSRKASRCIFLKHKSRWNNNIKLTKAVKI